MADTESFDQRTGREEFFRLMGEEIGALMDPLTGRVKADLCEETDCPVCKVSSQDKAFEKQGFQFWKCTDCQLIYVSPQLQSLRIETHYRESGETSRAWIQVLESEENKKWQIPYFKDALRKLRSAGFKDGELLDVGCSTGIFLEICRDEGVLSSGIELDEVSRAYAVEKRKLKVSDKLLNETNFEAGRYSAITLFGVLEHLSSPREFLREAQKMLKPGGLFLAIVPNLHSLTNMVLREDARTFTGINHLQYFTPTALEKIFTLEGLERKDLSTVLEGFEPLANRLQFRSAFGSPSLAFLPPFLGNAFGSDEGKASLKSWLHENLMGLYVCGIFQKPASLNAKR